MSLNYHITTCLKVTAVALLMGMTTKGAYAEVKIASATSMAANPLPHASSMLDVESTTSGVLLPRMTSAQRDAISLPAEGLIVFNTEENCLQEQRLAATETYTTSNTDGTDLVYNYPWWECMGWKDSSIPEPIAATTLKLTADVSIPQENAYHVIPWGINTDTLGMMNTDGSFTPKKSGWYSFQGQLEQNYPNGINNPANYDIFVIAEKDTINEFDAERPFIHRQNVYYEALRETHAALGLLGETAAQASLRALEHKQTLTVSTTVYLEAGKTYATGYFSLYSGTGGMSLIAIDSGYTGLGYVSRLTIQYIAD